MLVNSQWRSRWCFVRDSHLHFYQDRNRSKVAQQPLRLLGCDVLPDPSPDHLYSFRILQNGEELAKLEVLLAAGQAGRAAEGRAVSDVHGNAEDQDPTRPRPVWLPVVFTSITCNCLPILVRPQVVAL